MSHAVWAPSAMSRNLPCPPSAILSQGMKDEPGEKAIEGTRVHAVVEKHMRAGSMPAQLLSWVVRDNDNLSDYEVVGYTRAYVQSLGAGTVHYEQKVVLTKGCWGTLDIDHIGDIVTVFDFKNGGWDVEAKNNKQLLTYAATFLDAYPHAQWFRLVIFQPNSWSSDEMFKQHVHSRAEVEQHRREVLAAMTYEGPPKPGPHCRWCPAFSRCPVMSQDANFMMAAIARIDILTPLELTRMLRVVRNLSDMKEKLEERLTVMLRGLAPEAHPDGTGLKQSRKWRAFNDPKHAADTLYRLHGNKGVKPIGVAEAEKLGAQAKAYVAAATHKPTGEFKAFY